MNCVWELLSLALSERLDGTQFVEKPVQRMRKNKEFNELESLKFFFNSFCTPTRYRQEKEGDRRRVFIWLLKWHETLSLNSQRIQRTNPSVFSHQIVFMTFSVFLLRSKQTLEPFQFHRLLRNTDLLMTTCARRGEKKVLLISIKLRAALKYVDDRDRLLVLGLEYTKANEICKSN